MIAEHNCQRLSFRISCVFVMLSAVPTCVAELPPDPHNAALLYYQAFLMCPEPNAPVARAIGEIMYGAEIDDTVKQYIMKCHKAIDIGLIGSNLTMCDWGTLYSEGYSNNWAYLERARFFGRLLSVDARIIAAAGEYRLALQRCLAARRFARHVGNETLISHAFSLEIDRSALLGLWNILQLMPPDVTAVEWLLAKLSTMSPVPRHRALETELELVLRSISADQTRLRSIRCDLAEAPGEASRLDDCLTDDQLIARIREPAQQFLDGALGLAYSREPYSEVVEGIDNLARQLEQTLDEDAVAQHVASDVMAVWASHVSSAFGNMLLQTARLNAFLAAIEIHLIKLEAGDLPVTIPEGLPEDPYSNTDFEYEKTSDGFLLRSPAVPIEAMTQPEFRFKTRGRTKGVRYKYHEGTP